MLLNLFFFQVTVVTNTLNSWWYSNSGSSSRGGITHNSCSRSVHWHKFPPTGPRRLSMNEHKYEATTETLRGHLVLTAVCLTTGLLSFPFCSHVFLSATSWQKHVHIFLSTIQAKFSCLNTRGRISSSNWQKTCFSSSWLNISKTSFHTNQTCVCHTLLAVDSETTYGA